MSRLELSFLSPSESEARTFMRLVAGLPPVHRRMVKALLLRVADVETEAGEGAALSLIGQIGRIISGNDRTH